MHAEMSIVFHIRSRANRQLIRCWFFKCFSFDLYFDVEHQRWPPHHGRRNASRQFIFAENAASLELWTWIKSITRILIFFFGHIPCSSDVLVAPLSPPRISWIQIQLSNAYCRVCADINPSDISSFALSVFRIHQCHQRTLLSFSIL